MNKIITSRLFLACSSATIVLAILVFVGFSLRNNDQAKALNKPKNITTTSSTTTSSTTTTTTLPQALIQPAAANLPLLGNGITLGSGSNSPNVALYEQRLADLKFDPGTIDNIFDSKTNYAVQSLQKLKGLPVTGRIGDSEIQNLNTFQYDQPHVYPGESKRFEVNLDKQVGILYENYQVRLITTVSTGSGQHYSYVSKKTGRQVSSIANTPTGRFTFYRRYKGWEKSDLGRLYNPVYFKGGVAVHGYPSVPAKPASHGCTRIPMYIAEYFPSLVSNGDAVYVYGSKEVPYIADKVGAVVTTQPTTTTTVPTTTTTATTTTTTTIPVPST
ncbi:MAG: L,D-transpeptidase family protein [Acidimicrobiia bacterium]